MLLLPVPDGNLQDVSRRDSSVQVDLMERSPSPVLSRSEIGIQAEVPETNVQIQGKIRVWYLNSKKHHEILKMHHDNSRI